jgi:NAD(P)-dependent dehydrogenase (short-subunit alcohol dehydrogenase family)
MTTWFFSLETETWDGQAERKGGTGHRFARGLVHGRNAERGARVLAEIESQRRRGNFLATDLSSLTEVGRISGAAQATVDRLEILINNAGIGRTARQRGSWTSRLPDNSRQPIDLAT